jgi:hypothetical protein
VLLRAPAANASGYCDMRCIYLSDNAREELGLYRRTRILAFLGERQQRAYRGEYYQSDKSIPHNLFKIRTEG